jgi:hypothetical protein
LVEGVEFEPMRFLGPGLADGFEWSEAAEGLQPAGEVVGVEEVGQMHPQLLV